MSLKVDRNQILSKYGSNCGYCGVGITIKEMQIDHIIPQCQINRHGEEAIHSIKNLMPSCRSCNNYKGGSSLEEFRNYLLGKLHERLIKQPMYKVACRFGIIEIKQWDKKFYFERV